jgi:riboflavin kinase/FMN adenylyltransferase
MTAGGGAAVTIETYVLDFSRNLYGRNVTVEFLLRLREERKFSGKDALAAQIRKDILKARRYFVWLKRAAPALLEDSVPKTLRVS